MGLLLCKPKEFIIIRLSSSGPAADRNLEHASPRHCSSQELETVWGQFVCYAVRFLLSLWSCLSQWFAQEVFPWQISMVHKTVLNLQSLQKSAVSQSLDIFFKKTLFSSRLGQTLIFISMGLLLQSKLRFVYWDDRTKAGELLWTGCCPLQWVPSCNFA